MDILEENGNDPIINSFIINNFPVYKVLVNENSAMKVLIFNAFKKIGLDKNILKPKGLTYDFVNQPIKVKGLITFPITLGKRENIMTEKAKFLVVDQPSTYNAIIGQPLMK